MCSLPNQQIRKRKKTTRTFFLLTMTTPMKKRMMRSSNSLEFVYSPNITRFPPQNKKTPFIATCLLSIRLGERLSISFSFIPSFSLISSSSMSVTLVCGSRNAGKSVYCRALRNSLLNNHEKVAFLDIDVGQGDGTPEGYLSLSLFSTPHFRGSTVCHINRHLFRFETLRVCDVARCISGKKRPKTSLRRTWSA